MKNDKFKHNIIACKQVQIKRAEELIFQHSLTHLTIFSQKFKKQHKLQTIG